LIYIYLQFKISIRPYLLKFMSRSLLRPRDEKLEKQD